MYRGSRSEPFKYIAMKRLPLITLFALFLMPAFTQAQITIGAHGGFHSNKVQIKGISDSWIPENGYWTSGVAGIHAEIPLLDGLAFRPELNYIEKGFTVREGFEFNLFNIPIPVGAKAITRVQYIEVPLQLKYTFSDGPVQPYIFGGPHVSYAVDGQIDLKANFILDFNIGSYDIDMTNDLYNQFEVGAIAGAGLTFQAGRSNLFLQGSFQHGFTNMLDDPIIDIRLRNSGFNVIAGIQIPF